MHYMVQEYINKINAGTYNTLCIYLTNYNLTDQDIAPLMNTLANNKAAASKLHRLFLDENKLTTLIIPETFVALQELFLGENKLTTLVIPETLVALQRLSMDENKLTTVVIPETLVALQKLDLNSNQLTAIVIPKTLVALKTLGLSDNKLTAITIPETLVKLKNLFLHNNKLTTLFIPETLVKLETLCLNNNQLINIIFPEYLPDIQILSIEDNPLSLTSLIAFKAFSIKNRSAYCISIFQSFNHLLISIHFNNLTTDLPVTFKSLIRNLSIVTQEQYLLEVLKESINLVLISAPTLNQNMRFNGDLIFSAAKFNMPFSSFEKQIINNNDMIIRLLNIFNIHDDMQISNTESDFFNTSLLAIEAYQKEHIDDLNNTDLIKAFNEELAHSVKVIYDLLQSLRDMDGIKNEPITREFFAKLKPILMNTGFREEALDHKKLLPILMPLLVANKVKTKPKLTM
jgi:hypothetical protein